MKKSIPLPSAIVANVQEPSSMNYIFGYFPNACKFDVREIVPHNPPAMTFDGIYNAEELLLGKYDLKQRIVNEYELQLLAKAGKLMPVFSVWKKYRREIKTFMAIETVEKDKVVFNMCYGIQERFKMPIKHRPLVKTKRLTPREKLSTTNIINVINFNNSMNLIDTN